jgi:hypothetical protein
MATKTLMAVMRVSTRMMRTMKRRGRCPFKKQPPGKRVRSYLKLLSRISYQSRRGDRVAYLNRSRKALKSKFKDKKTDHREKISEKNRTK